MSRAKGNQKTPHQLTRELEDQLHLLVRDLTDLQNGDIAALRDLSARLRNLVTHSSGLPGLLWRLCDHYKVDDSVQVSYVGEVDPTHPLAANLSFAFVPPNQPNTPTVQCPLREFLAIAEAAYVDQVSLTHDSVIKQVSQNFGTAHSAPSVTPEMTMLGGVLMGNAQSFTVILDADARLVLEVGQRVLVAAAAKHGYQSCRQPLPGPPAVALQNVEFGNPVDIPTRNLKDGEHSLFYSIDVRGLDLSGGLPISFREFAAGNVVVRSWVNRRRKLVVAVDGLPMPYFGCEVPWPDDATDRLTIALTWKAFDIKAFIQGKQVAGAP